MSMKTKPIPLSMILSTMLLLAGCVSQETRTAGVEHRQDRMDSRMDARQERWQIRGEHEDARADATFDAIYH